MNLNSHPFFTIFNAGAAEQLMKAVEVLSLADKAPVFKEGDTADCMYLVLEGEVDLTKKDPSGQHQSLTQAMAGDYFGEFGLLDGKPRSAGAVCKGATSLARISRDAVMDLFRKSPESSLSLAADIIEKMRKANERFAEEHLRNERMGLLDKITSKIVQDFKGPFTAMRMTVFTIDKRNGKDEATHKLCQIIEEQADRMQRMIEEVRDFSHGRTQVSSKPLNIAMVFKKFLENNREFMAQQNITLSVADIKPLLMEGDEEKLVRVLQNLLNHSVEAFGSKPGTVTVDAAKVEESVRITYSDSAVPIPPEIQAMVFDPFASAGDKKVGNLSLAMARAMVEAHQGQILVNAAKTDGRQFDITLPIHQKV